MFCPEGFVTMTEIVRIFEDRLFERFLQMHKETKHDLDIFFSNSPLDDLEYFALRFIGENSFVVSPEGNIFKIDFLSINQSANTVRISIEDLDFLNANSEQSLPLHFANIHRSLQNPKVLM